MQIQKIDLREHTMLLDCTGVRWRVAVVHVTPNFEPGFGLSQTMHQPATVELSFGQSRHGDRCRGWYITLCHQQAPSMSWTFCLARSNVAKASDESRFM